MIESNHSFRWSVFGLPIYFAAHGRPLRQADIAYRCIRFRRPLKDDIYRWELVEDGTEIRVEPEGPTIVNDGELMRQMASRGLDLI